MEVSELNLVSSAMEQLISVKNMQELRLHRDLWQPLWHDALPQYDIFTWNEQLNQWHDAMFERTLRFCEELLAQEGWGRPPARYAFILFGSGGRAEQAPWSDQDHGFIMEDHVDEEGLRYFERFSEEIVRQLVQLGFPRCKGDVLCSNPLWRKTLQGWQEQLAYWLAELNWEHVRYLLIAMDMRLVCGDAELARQWRAALAQLLERTPGIREAMLRNTLFYKVSVNPFGQLIRERFGDFAGGVNLKYGAYIPLVNGLRYMMLTSTTAESGTRTSGLSVSIELLAQTSTGARLRTLKQHSHSHPKLAELIQQCELAFRSVLARRAALPYVLEDGEYVSHGFLEEQNLSREVVRGLKQELLVVQQLQRYLNKQIRTQSRNER